MAFFATEGNEQEAPAEMLDRALKHRDKLADDVRQVQEQFEASSKNGDPDRKGTSAYVWGQELDEAKAKLAEAERGLLQVIDQTAVVTPVQPIERAPEGTVADTERERGPERDWPMEILENLRHEAIPPIHAHVKKEGDIYKLRHELVLPFSVGPTAAGTYAMYGGYGVPCGLGGSGYTTASPVSVDSPGGAPTDVGAGTANYYLELHFTITGGVVSYVDTKWVASATANTADDLYAIVGGRVGPGGTWVQFHVGNITIPMR